MAKQSPAPTCEHCGRPLRPYRRTQFFPSNAEAAKFAAAVPAPKLSYDRLGVYPETPYRVDYRAGWGGYGDDRFCGLNCGYKWAIRHQAAK